MNRAAQMFSAQLGLGLGLVLLLSACGGGSPAPTPPPAPDPKVFSGLQILSPGKADDIDAKLRINIVMVGYKPTPTGQVAGPRDVNVSDFGPILPKSYDTIARIPSAYGTVEPTGNRFDFEYNFKYADQAFEDDFFRYLDSIAVAKPPTLFQTAYNCQFVPDADHPPCEAPAGNVRVPVTDNNWIDGPKTEAWLAQNAGRLGVNKDEYTVFLVNWYGRPDFRFHVYTKTDAPEPDTGFNFGEARASRKMIAYGGSSSRSWFYDLSAGPEAWTDNWDITNPDVTGDKVPDYRMPPIWDYGTNRATYRSFGKVGPDLARVVRYIAVNLLFTPSPIYRAALTPPDMPENIQLDFNVAEGDPANPGKAALQPDLIQNALRPLQPFANLSSSLRETPLDGPLAQDYTCFVTDDACSPDLADASGGKLFDYAVQDLRANPAIRDRYVVPTYSFNAKADSPGGLLGIAIDDGVTGTQAFVYSFLQPNSRDVYGFSSTLIHEIGHHFSLSHPHDGYDSEQDLSYGPDGDFLFVNDGDESDTVMTYNDLSLRFGQFNQDSQYRYLTAAYLNNANAVLALTQDAAKADVVQANARNADAQFAQALLNYRAMRYFDAAAQAHAAYRQIVDSAKAAGVNVQPYKWYDNVTSLSAQRQAARPRVSRNNEAVQGPAIMPESTPYQRRLRSLP